MAYGSPKWLVLLRGLVNTCAWPVRGPEELPARPYCLHIRRATYEVLGKPVQLLGGLYRPQAAHPATVGGWQVGWSIGQHDIVDPQTGEHSSIAIERLFAGRELHASNEFKKKKKK